MGQFNLRSLLLAAIVISNCITWTASRHHYTHNVHGHRSRHRRQGAGLYLSSSYVIPGGEGTGAWGEWGEVSPCSRTCGGGVANQKRICLEVGPNGQPLCTGGDTKYFSCETQDCPDGSKDFRADQCSEFDDVAFKGIKYTWVPYTKGPNPCELNCMPQGERFYYRQRNKVIDGTRCNEESFDVCVNGTCQPVGCDFMLGSPAREDKCRECRGNGANCHTVSDIIDTQDLRNGYNDILLIPQGATSIFISEVKPSSNYLAIRAQNNTYYLNGDYHIDFPRTIEIAGATWHYERSQNGLPSPDKLRCLGPTNEPLLLSLLQQQPNVGVQYEYSVPQALAPPPNQQYNWVHEEFTPCSVTCGGGYQTRNVTCRSREELEIVDESLCNAMFRPVTNQSCSTNPCAAKWVEGPWGPCSELCGEGGSRSRQVHCEKIITNGYPSVVADKECFELLGPKPPLFEECNKNATCPLWFAGPWKPCDKLCDEGKQTRQVVCYQKVDGKIEVLDDQKCTKEKPSSEQPCMLHPCDGVDWVVTDWIGCDTCLSTVRTRTAVCATKERKVVNDSFCEYHAPPTLQEPCDRTKLPPCEVQWYATQWSKCSAECGKGVQTRRVFCGLFDGASVLKVDDERCANETRYNDTKPCEVAKCPAKWFAGPWSECSAECGGGEQYRRVMCLRGTENVKDCDADAVIDSTQSCNLEPCNEDEIIPVNPNSTPIMDYEYEDCEEDEEYPEVGAIEDTSLTGLPDMMYSDSPYTELESEFTSETGSGFSTLFTEGSGSSSTDSTLSSIDEDWTSTDETGSTSDTFSTETEDTSETVSADTDSSLDYTTTEVYKDSSTESSSEVSGSTEESSTDSASTDESTESGATSSSGDDLSTEKATTTSGSSESVSTETELNVSASTDILGSTDTDITTESNTEETGSTVTDETVTFESTESSSTDETTESSPTDETTESSTSETSESSTSDETTETTESGSTESETEETSGSTEISSLTEAATEGGSTELLEGSSTESSVSTESEPTDSSEPSGSTESDNTESTEASSTEAFSSTEFSESTTESGSTDVTSSTDTSESPETTESGTTETGLSTEETGSTESSATETGSTESATEETGSTVSEETGSTVTESSEGSTEGLSSVSGFSEESTVSGETTPYDWATTIELVTKKQRCKPRASKCAKTKFGCCPDKKTPAAGPFDEGCATPKTCKETKFGCCPDGVSPAAGPKNKGCPILPCLETLFGCCKSDNKTPAEGNDQEGCPPPCKSSKYGCCKDGQTTATGPKKAGCPETEAQKEAERKAAASNATTVLPGGAGCNATEFGCCPDGVSSAAGAQMQGCIMSCNSSAYGCCPDGQTPAHGYDYEGCCLLYPFGCCPDNYKPAEGPHLEGCGCQHSHFGCCPDNVTLASGPDNEGCGCQYTDHGCCPDRHTPASGPDFEGCDCHTYQFGCCDDGVTIAKGPGFQGCHCQQSEFGCCGDGKTAASGPDQAGCDCSTSKYGCCPDGQTPAGGSKFFGCTDKPVIRQAACALSTDRGPCTNYSVYWYYDLQYGGCSRFWYGGCEGNGNRFTSKEECEDVCVSPAPKDACNLPMVKGACTGYHPRWFYDASREHCSQFIFGGCLGNANNFDSRELCQKQCEPARSDDQCALPIDEGSCAGNFPRWGYNMESQRCEQFVWGGCEGNTNRFSSEAACVHRCSPPGAPKPQCKLPQEAGNCTEKYPLWAFSQTEDRCVPFYFSGCGGNDNRFDSQRSCSETCPSSYVKHMCTLPAVTGDCAEYTEKWYFDTAIKRCRQFYYGGCGGNENRFSTERECERQCSEPEVAPVTPSPQITTPADVCSLPSMTGDCDRYETKWFFDSNINRCRQFYYGGCGGNNNRFESQSDCEARCLQTTTTTVQPQTPPPQPSYGQEICFMPVESGPCSQTVERWAYEAARGACVPFSYGGCGGNQNNFPDRDYCQHTCGSIQDVCQLPMLSGPCDGSQMRWFYDPTSDSCSQFTYGGCGGNDNRFESVEECERRCRTGPEPVAKTTTAAPNVTAAPAPGDEIPPLCHIYPEANEECVEEGDVWYLDVSQHACVAYSNPGSGRHCRRTGVFFSEEACERTCGAFRNIDVCRYPLDPGPCRGGFPKFYYNEALGSCLAFSYGGCHGGPNRFSTIDECEDTCKFVNDPCKRTPKPVNCFDYVEAWFFDESRDECYSYGSCDPNDSNRFATREECEGQCKREPSLHGATSTTAAAPIPQPSGGECETPRSFVGCNNATIVFYYDAERRACMQSNYGDCGHANAYSSVEECERRCGAFRGLEEGNEPNEVLPDCDESSAECARLSCLYGVQRTRGPDGCERCACVTLEVDCAPLQQECRDLKCAYGLTETVGADNCTRCTCIDHPCANKQCPPGQRCVATPFRDPIAQEVAYMADCHVVNKSGSCPASEEGPAPGAQCRRECNDDADCRGAAKCCARGCSAVCLAPPAPTSPATYTTTYTPELLQAPQANPVTEPEVKAEEGGKATLRCLFHGNPPPKITWRRGEITIDGNVGRYRLMSDGALEIVSLYRNDSGVYICVAENIHGVSQQEVHLQVNDPVESPAGISGEANAVVTGELGHSLNIRCLAYGYPSPSIYWYRGRHMLPYSNELYEARENVLQIRRLDLNTLGEYSCQAFNGVGKAAFWSVEVRAYQTDDQWDHELLVPHERTVEITPALPKTLTTSTPAPEIDMPVYTVVVNTSIPYEQTTLEVGGELSLPCDVDGYPLPEVFWTKDNVRLASDARTQITDARLTISGLTQQDSGVYGCHARNELTSHSSTIQITVQDIVIPVHCTDNPFFADCKLIVRSKFCNHQYYSRFCCESCVKAGQLKAVEMETQADEAWKRKK